jgi:hypothetical protein
MVRMGPLRMAPSGEWSGRAEPESLLAAVA